MTLAQKPDDAALEARAAQALAGVVRRAVDPAVAAHILASSIDPQAPR
jgi:hypothetical protein